MSQRGHDSLCAVVDPEFSQNRGDVVLDRLRADAQRIADFGIGQPGADVPENLKLTLREWHRLARVAVFAMAGTSELVKHSGCDIWLGEQLFVDHVFAMSRSLDQLMELSFLYGAPTVR